MRISSIACWSRRWYPCSTPVTQEQGIPRGWVDRMKHALHVAGRGFTARRMVREVCRADTTCRP